MQCNILRTMSSSHTCLLSRIDRASSAAAAAALGRLGMMNSDASSRCFRDFFLVPAAKRLLLLPPLLLPGGASLNMSVMVTPSMPPSESTLASPSSSPSPSSPPALPDDNASIRALDFILFDLTVVAMTDSCNLRLLVITWAASVYLQTSVNISPQTPNKPFKVNQHQHQCRGRNSRVPQRLKYSSFGPETPNSCNRSLSARRILPRTSSIPCKHGQHFITAQQLASADALKRRSVPHGVTLLAITKSHPLPSPRPRLAVQLHRALAHILLQHASFNTQNPCWHKASNSLPAATAPRHSERCSRVPPSRQAR